VLQNLIHQLSTLQQLRRYMALALKFGKYSLHRRINLASFASSSLRNPRRTTLRKTFLFRTYPISQSKVHLPTPMAGSIHIRMPALSV
jgi:hypothetical protein